MPIKTWAPYERLLAGDLNSNFNAAVRHPFPGVQLGQGSPVSIGANATVEIPGAAPVAWQDPLGYYQAGRLVVPAAYGGMHLVYATALVTSGTGPRRLQIEGNTALSMSSPGMAGIGMYLNVAGVWNMPAATTTWAKVLASTDGCTATLIVFSLVRIAPAFGAPESLLVDLLKEGALDSEVFPVLDAPPPLEDAGALANPPPPDQAADLESDPPTPR